MYLTLDVNMRRSNYRKEEKKKKRKKEREIYNFHIITQSSL